MTHLPFRLADFIPAMLRGHGSMKHKTVCVDRMCKGEHLNRQANCTDWKEERGLVAPKKEKPKKERTLPPLPTPVATLPPRSTKCQSCGWHPDDGTDPKAGLELGICPRCWSAGHSRGKHKQQEEEQAA